MEVWKNRITNNVRRMIFDGHFFDHQEKKGAMNLILRVLSHLCTHSVSLIKKQQKKKYAANNSNMMKTMTLATKKINFAQKKNRQRDSSQNTTVWVVFGGL